VIDPAITYSTYLGGSYSSAGNSVAVYSEPVTGHVYAYVAGGTCDTDFPTKNALQPTFAQQGCAANIGYDWVGDAFVAKIDPSASGAASLIWSTYLGGSDNADFASAIAVDSSGNAYVTGNTNSADFPTVNAFQSARKSPPSSSYYPTTADAFLSKLSADGSLLYSTYFGGSKSEFAHAIALDSVGRAYIAGQTASSDLPTVNPFQAVLRAQSAGAFLAVFDPARSGQTSLLYATYLSGSSTTDGDAAFGLAVDAAFGVHLGGITTSPDFPIANGFQNNFLGGMSFYAKLNPFAPSSSQLVYSTFLGGAGGVGGLGGVMGIAVDSAGNAFVAGDAGPGQVPATPGAYAAPTNPGDAVAFVAKINPALSGSASLIYCASLSLPQVGGGALATGIAVDATGNAFIVGYAAPGIPLVNPAQDASVGLFESVDAGATWISLNQGLQGDYRFRALAIDTSSAPRRLYAGTAGGTVYSSTDGGLNWRDVLQVPVLGERSPCTDRTAGCVFALAVDPTSPSNVFAGTTNGVYKSTDSGDTGNLLNEGLSSIAVQAIYSLTFDGSTLYGGTRDGLYKLTSGDTSWNLTSLNYATGYVTVDQASTPHIIYAGTGDYLPIVGPAVPPANFKSTDGGRTWMPFTGFDFSACIDDLSIDPTTNPSTLYYFDNIFCDQQFAKSTDGGNTWTSLYPDWPEAVGDPFLRRFTLDSTRNPHIFYVDSLDGLLKTADDGNNWKRVGPGSLGVLQTDPTTGTPNSPAVLYVGNDQAPLNVFLAELNSTGSELLFSTYLGGMSGAQTLGNGIAVDAARNVYVVGGTSSVNFPVVNGLSANSANTLPGGVSSAFLTKIGTQSLPQSAPGSVAVQVGVPIGTLTVSLPNITGSTTGSEPTLSITPLSASDTANFALSNNLGAYDISTTATYSGTVTLCFPALTVNDVGTFNNLQLIHIVDGTATNITSSHDFSTRSVCGSTMSLSPFVLFNPTTNTTLGASVNPSVSGEPVTFAARVTSSGSPTGNVTFSDGATVLASIPLTSGGASFSTSSLAVGSHSITATFSGDSRWNGSTSSIVSQVVNRAATSIAVSTSGSPSIDNQGVTLTATVTVLTPGLGTPTGSVTFKDGSTTFGTGALNNGTVTFTTSALGVGTHSITAVYAGDLNFGGSGSTPAIQQVQYEPAGTSCLGAPAHQILQPINADGTSVWKQGRTIPAQFRVCDANGVSIGTAGVISSFSLSQIISGTITNVDETVSSTTTDSAFHWDTTNQQWVFNISTKSLAANNTYVYTIGLNDGTTIAFKYGLK
jgi:hypothetical protein